MTTVAIVTGASAGLGWEFARQLDERREVNEIWLVARRADRLAALAQQLRHAHGVPIALDLAAGDAHVTLGARLRERAPRVRWLVNNAGHGLIGHTAKLDLEPQLRMIDLNVRALVALTHVAVPFMQRGDRIVQVASAAAFAPMPGFNTYAATKAFVWSFSQGLGAELARQGVTVTTVLPGPVATEFNEVAGVPADRTPALLNADPADVVRRALDDAARGRPASVYGAPLRAYRLLANALPNRALMAVFKRVYRR